MATRQEGSYSSEKYVSEKYKDLLGSIYQTKHGGTCQIIEIRNLKSITVVFSNGYRTTCTLANLKEGSVFNPYQPKLYGVGFIGEGTNSAKIDGKISYNYDRWRGMLRRCYSEEMAIKSPTYLGCSVAEEWHNYQNFCEWSNRQVYELDFKLDKDLLINGNKLYSAETCVYLPNELNCIISISDSRFKDRLLPKGVSRVCNPRAKDKIWAATMSVRGRSRGELPKVKQIGLFETIDDAAAAYVFAKEEYVKERADFWRGRISENAYHALINWRVYGEK